MDEWRAVLYPLGFLSSLAFGARILVQWGASEAKKTSVVPKLFWQLSLIGNLLLMLHSFIQVQYHVFFIQIGNAVISWRNLNLMQPEANQMPLKKVVLLLILSFISCSFLFMTMNHLNFYDITSWFRIPSSFINATTKPIHFSWHILGFLGLSLFSSRFWIQWIDSERKKTSVLSKSFWWISLIGDLLVLGYFAKIKDSVNLIGPVFGLIPYIRNLMLLKQQNTKAKV